MNRHYLAPLVCSCAWLVARQASAQIDPLLFLKDSQPAVLIALDVSSRMQRDLAGRYLDPLVYDRTGAAWEDTIGVTAANTARFYRRRYAGLTWLDPEGPSRAAVAAIEIVGDQQSGFATFDGQARLAIARAALSRAIQGNRLSSRFGLVTGRRATPRFQQDPPATVLLQPTDPLALTETGIAGTWNAVIGTVDAAAEVPESGVVVRADDAGATEAVIGRLAQGPLDAGALVPAGLDRAGFEDAPLLQLLDDIRQEADRLIAADASCRNTVAVLVTGGGQHPPGDVTLASRAAALLRVGGRRVPLHVVALAPDPVDGEALRELAAVCGGRYVEIPATSGAPPPDADATVTAVTAAVNFAIQHGFARFADVNVLPTASLPLGPASEFPMAPPIVGTLDIENLVTDAGVLLPLARVTTPSGAVIPQASNVLFTAGFTLPGFDGRIRAFRVYRPQPDPAGPGGYRFVADGTRIWTATTPPPASRNIVTVLPGRGVVPFDGGQVDRLAPYLRVRDPAALVAAIRSHPLGAVTTSTPALLTPPALPGGDDASRAFVEAHRERRALLFVGLDDGMMHAFDARTGLEVWAVIPFNLLPRLQFLLDGQPLDAFQPYVGGSPRLADIVSGGEWRTVLVFGEGAGGTFYQAFDVTLEGAARALPPGADRRSDLLGWFGDPGRIPFLWSFPSYEHFDAGLGSHGDLAAAASEVEKSVGQSWSTPAILGARPATPSLALLGSGPLPESVQRGSNRGGTVAGTRVYLLDARSGAVLESRDVGSDGEGEEQDGCPASGCTRFKNAVAADPVVVPGAGHPTRAYVGDLDGRLWRFELAEGGEAPQLSVPRLVFSAGAWHPVLSPVGTVRAGTGGTYVFLGTGGDQLAMSGERPASRILTLFDSPSGVMRVAELSLESRAGGGRDERLSALPAAGGEVIFFSATAAPANGCEPAESHVYALTISGGSAFDTTGDDRRDAEDAPRVASLATGRATAPTVADRHLFVATGDHLQVFGDPSGFNAGPGFVGVRVLSWREVGKAPRP